MGRSCGDGGDGKGTGRDRGDRSRWEREGWRDGKETGGDVKWKGGGSGQGDGWR